MPSTPWPDLLVRLRQASVPVLVVTGTRDVIVDDRAEQEARDRGATVVRLTGAGHCVRREAGTAYTELSTTSSHAPVPERPPPDAATHRPHPPT